MKKYDVTVVRSLKRKIGSNDLKEQLQTLRDRISRHWDAVSILPRLIKEVETGTGPNRRLHYSAVITLKKDRYRDENAVQRGFDHTLNILNRSARRLKWRVASDEALAVQPDEELAVVNGAGDVMDDPAPRLLNNKKPAPKPSIYMTGEALPPLTDDVFNTYFKRIYDREAHIRIIYDHLCLAVKTNFKVRHHTLLKGKPACAKSELFLAFIDWLGDDFIESIDASTMTKAGLEHHLMKHAEMGTLKPILIMEEIEKTDDANVSCLIQVMDARGKIQRTNANTVREGLGALDCKPIIWGTCNDEDALEKFHKGAIWSRFGNKLECVRPDRTLMERILKREVEEIGGKDEWIDPVLKFCFEELVGTKLKGQHDDPRFVRSFLAGGDRLLDDGPKGFLADFRKVNGLK